MIKKSFPERRQFKRVYFDLPVQLKQIPQVYPLRVHNSISQDISEGGIKLASFYFHPVNSKVVLEIFLSTNVEPVKAVGRVVWIEQLPYQDRYKIGFEFAEINEDGHHHLKDLIANTLAPL